MQFLIIAYDFTDEEAFSRRMNARNKHIEYSNKLIKNKQMIFGVALLDENGKMIGSTCVYEFPSKSDLEKMLKNEPYIVERVWDNIEIKPCKLGPSFESYARD